MGRREDRGLKLKEEKKRIWKGEEGREKSDAMR